MSNAQNDARPLYLFGCDMGGWHNKKNDKGDALAVCKCVGTNCSHVEATAALTFFPVSQNGPLVKALTVALSEQATIIVCIDAAFSWPETFRQLVAEVPQSTHEFSFTLTEAINNPYLYRETDKFIKSLVLQNRNPLTAVGDKFGNNSSKAQALVRWFLDQMPDAYRPPFHEWDRDRAQKARHTIIEVYPAASMKSKAFKQLTWPPHSQDMGQIGNSDIADAMRCAMTGFCYAAQLEMFEPKGSFPALWLPDDALVAGINRERLRTEGWIFSPKASAGKRTTNQPK